MLSDAMGLAPDGDRLQRPPGLFGESSFCTATVQPSVPGPPGLGSKNTVRRRQQRQQQLQRLRAALRQEQERQLHSLGFRELHTFVDAAKTSTMRPRSASWSAGAKTSLDEYDLADSQNQGANLQLNLTEISPRLRLGEPDPDLDQSMPTDCDDFLEAVGGLALPKPPSGDDDDECCRSAQHDPMMQLKVLASSVAEEHRCRGPHERDQFVEYLLYKISEDEANHELLDDALHDEHDLLELQTHLLRHWTPSGCWQ